MPSLRVNTVATVELLEFLKNDHPEIRVGLTVNGNGEWNNTYAITKETAGRFALMFNKEFGTKFAVVRPFNAFGEWQKSRPIRKIGPHVISRALQNAAIEIFGSGEQQFDLVYAGDVGEALARSILWPVDDYSRVFECGTGSTVTPISFSETVTKLIEGAKPEFRFLPMRSGEPPMSVLVADVSTMEPLGLSPKGTDRFESDLSRTIEWYRFALAESLDSYIDRE
jgi:nucleoside-diphosphate-sugar epimerase